LKNQKKEDGFDRNMNASGCKYWKVYFDPDDKDDRFLYLTQSSEEEWIDISDENKKEMENRRELLSFVFFYSYKTTCYTLSCVPPP